MVSIPQAEIINLKDAPIALHKSLLLLVSIPQAEIINLKAG